MVLCPRFCFFLISLTEFGFVERRLKFFNKKFFLGKDLAVAPIVRLDFQKGSEQKLSFSTCSKVFVYTLLVVLRIADGTSVVATAVSYGSFSLSNIVMAAGWTSYGIKDIHSVARKMVAKFENVR